MDKDNLYYLVVPGTNERSMTSIKNEPFIGDKDGAETRRDGWETSKVLISIRQFETKYLNKIWPVFVCSKNCTGESCKIRVTDDELDDDSYCPVHGDNSAEFRLVVSND